ncbi:MAG: hypothetical protein EPO21_21480 [Chloroflexota bacterium]|nr:MAG: hypothetical protein EPO21_21480 [Chloroflexota bacterium]
MSRNERLTDVVILSAARSPLGKHDSGLATVRPVELGALVLRAAVARAKIEPAMIEETIYGCLQNLREQSGNVARKIVLAACFPETVPGITVHRICRYGQSAS